MKEIPTSSKLLKITFQLKKGSYLKKNGLDKNILTEQELITFEQFKVAASIVDKIVNRYQLKSLDIEVDLFRAKDDENFKSDFIHLGWKKATLKGFKIHDIPGNHFELFSPSHDVISARIIQDV